MDIVITAISRNTRIQNVGLILGPDTTAKLQKTKQPHATGLANISGNHGRRSNKERRD